MPSKRGSKKGLQVEMVADAIALGIQHAALNFRIGWLVEIAPHPDHIEWHWAGATYYFNRAMLEQADHEIKSLSDEGINVALIILNDRNDVDEVNEIMLPAHGDPDSPHALYGFNVFTPQGIQYLEACAEFLTERYSRADGCNGRVVNFIIGNEVPSHGVWYNLGDLPMA